jgi:hypothetical protein
MVKVKIEILDQLLGDRAASAYNPPLAEVPPERLPYAYHVNSVMFKEAHVFELNDKLCHSFGDIVKGTKISLSGPLGIQLLNGPPAKLQQCMYCNERKYCNDCCTYDQYNAHVFLPYLFTITFILFTEPVLCNI